MLPELPRTLLARYKDERYISRKPFLLNKSLDSAEELMVLTHQDIGKKDIFLGIAGFHALDMLAAAGKDHGPGYRQAILFDLNTAQIKALHGVLVMIEKSETPADFIKLFAEAYPGWTGNIPRRNHDRQTDEDKAFMLIHGYSSQPMDEASLAKKLHAIRAQPTSWLNDSNYPRIKRLVDEGQVGTAILDLKDTDRVGILKDWLDKHHFHVRHVYLSSSPDFIGPKDHFDYYGKVNTMATAQHYVDNLQSLMGDGKLLMSEEQHGRDRLRYIFKLKERDSRYLNDLLATWRNTEYTPDNKSYYRIFQAGDMLMHLYTPSKEDNQHLPETRKFVLFIENRHASPDEDKAVKSVVEGEKFEISPELPHAPLNRVRFYVPKARLTDATAFYDDFEQKMKAQVAAAKVQRI